MILKWPGGKKWLYKKYNSLIPSSYNNYIEPFFGGGSVFFNLAPEKGIISDINPRLINLYCMLRDEPKKLFCETSKLIEKHSEDQYYKIRKKFNQSEENSSIYFLYLNRTCFNGVYRENQKGEFNVPIGKRKSNFFPFELNDFYKASINLKKTKILCCDYSHALKEVEKNDFIYVDPPYIKYEKNYDAFRKYNKDVFSRKDLEDLALELNRLKNKCKILVSNFDLPFVKELFKDWSYTELEQRTYISGTAKGRKLVKEALIFNY
tara:strand:- start:517 stop:1308 length:792 start_codon:yes stop_codon:yes gene_type:complete